MNRRRWLVVLGLALAAGLSGWLYYWLDEEPAEPRARRSLTPDYYMVNFERTTMGVDGAPHNVLRADYMQHFPDDDSTELENPSMEVYNADGPPWYIKAERGWVGADQEVVLLFGPVRVWRNNSLGDRELEVITTDLRILPDSQYAETDQPTTIISRTSVTHAIGMRADLGDQKLELLSEVRSRYEYRPDLPQD